jgi:hypothetical protein
MMNKEQQDQILTDISNMLSEGVDVTIPRKNVYMLLGTVIVANIATVMLCGGIAQWGKETAAKKKAKTDQNEGVVDIFPPDQTKS